MAEPHRELRWKYETEADITPRMSRRAELGLGIGSAAVMVGCAIGTRYGWEHEQPAVALSLGFATIGSARIASQYLAMQLNDAIIAVTNRNQSTHRSE